MLGCWRYVTVHTVWLCVALCCLVLPLNTFKQKNTSLNFSSSIEYVAHCSTIVHDSAGALGPWLLGKGFELDPQTAWNRDLWQNKDSLKMKAFWEPKSKRMRRMSKDAKALLRTLESHPKTYTIEFGKATSWFGVAQNLHRTKGCPRFGVRKWMVE